MIYNLDTWFPLTEFMLPAFLLSDLSSVVDSCVINQLQKVYQMDLFSIINLALSITALLITLFLGLFGPIISWLFFLASKRDSDATQQAVIKIESLVDNIHHDMMDIIRKIISDMNNVGGGVSNSDLLVKKIEELSLRFDQDISKKTEINHTTKKDISEILTELKVKAEEVKKKEGELKAKSMELSIEEIDRERLRQKIFDPEKYVSNSEPSKKESRNQ